MTHSGEAIKIIAKWEGFRPTLYRCPAGLPTIGYGHVILKNESHLEKATLSKEQALDLLNKDLISRYVPELNRLCSKHGVALKQNQFDAVLSFLYNCGGANLERSQILLFTKEGNISEAVRKFNLYTKARVNGVMKDLPGLVSRRKEEAELFMRA
ncbi:MAG: lysozyme [Brevinema sp.]